jgi:hypothetical protein
MTVQHQLPLRLRSTILLRKRGHPLRRLLPLALGGCQCEGEAEAQEHSAVVLVADVHQNSECLEWL